MKQFICPNCNREWSLALDTAKCPYCNCACNPKEGLQLITTPTSETDALRKTYAGISNCNPATLLAHLEQKERERDEALIKNAELTAELNMLKSQNGKV
jgi:hypothetical protein